MIELKKDFTRKGIRYQQLMKNEQIVLYRCSRVDGLDTYYEVFKRKVEQPNEFHNDEYERYPSDEAFGSWAWCCSNGKSVEKVLRKHFPELQGTTTYQKTLDLLTHLASESLSPIEQ